MNIQQKLLFFTIAAVSPNLLDACPMCQGGSTETSVFAYRATTIFLIMVPFAIGTALYKWIKGNSNTTGNIV